jgi:hypothetical protein
MPPLVEVEQTQLPAGPRGLIAASHFYATRMFADGPRSFFALERFCGRPNKIYLSAKSFGALRYVHGARRLAHTSGNPASNLLPTCFQPAPINAPARACTIACACQPSVAQACRPAARQRGEPILRHAAAPAEVSQRADEGDSVPAGVAEGAPLLPAQARSGLAVLLQSLQSLQSNPTPPPSGFCGSQCGANLILAGAQKRALTA